MTPQQIIKDVIENYSEYLEMMEMQEQFILITSSLANKLAFEMAEKEHYKTCFESFCSSKKGINS